MRPPSCWICDSERLDGTPRWAGAAYSRRLTGLDLLPYRMPLAIRPSSHAHAPTGAGFRLRPRGCRLSSGWLMRRTPPTYGRNQREQADLPAQQPPSGENPRLSRADEHPRRSRDPCRAPPQGPLRTVRLSSGAVLPAQHRLRASADFTAVMRGRGGVRASSRLLVVHANLPTERRLEPTRLGFVVSKAVGGSVTRNRTKRRLRAQCAARLLTLPDGLDVVVRANPAAGQASSAELGAALDSTLPGLIGRIEGRRG